MRRQANLYTIYGYKGKQVRISFIRRTLQSCWLEFHGRPCWGEVYNKGRVQANSPSVLETIPMLQDTGLDVRYEVSDAARIGDHICYEKVREHFPEWQITYNLRRIALEIVAKAL
jgi:CDP-paratose 2-epimerase